MRQNLINLVLILGMLGATAAEAGAAERKSRRAPTGLVEWMRRIDALNFSATATAAQRRERDKLLAAIVGVPDPSQRGALSAHFAQRAQQTFSGPTHP